MNEYIINEKEKERLLAAFGRAVKAKRKRALIWAALSFVAAMILAAVMAVNSHSESYKMTIMMIMVLTLTVMLCIGIMPFTEYRRLYITIMYGKPVFYAARVTRFEIVNRKRRFFVEGCDYPIICAEDCGYVSAGERVLFTELSGKKYIGVLCSEEL